MVTYSVAGRKNKIQSPLQTRRKLRLLSKKPHFVVVKYVTGPCPVIRAVHTWDILSHFIITITDGWIIATEWKSLYFWLFLGKLVRNSEFSEFPVEIISNFVIFFVDPDKLVLPITWLWEKNKH
jgi:hypothetical protein